MARGRNKKPAAKKAPVKRVRKVKEVPSTLPIEGDSFEVESIAPSKVAYTWRPIMFQIDRDRKKRIVIKSPEIKWSDLEEFQVKSQWLNCLNAFWEAEKEGKIARSDIEPYFYEYAEKFFGQNEAKTLRAFKAAEKVTMSVLASSFIILNLFSNVELTLNGEKLESYRGAVDASVTYNLKAANLVSTEKKTEKSFPVRRSPSESNLVYTALETLGGLEKDGKNVAAWLSEVGLSKSVADALKVKVAEKLFDIELYFDGDTEAKEFFSRWSRKQMSVYRDWWAQALMDLDSYGLVKRVVKKTRVRKPKPPSKIVNKLKFKFSDEALKLTSVKPETIVGAVALWVYDTKKRKLCVYNASKTDQQLSVKGTYIIGWDPATSTGKILRKPDEQLTKFMGSGKVAVKKFLTDIKAVEMKLKGKISKDMILLKTY